MTVNEMLSALGYRLDDPDAGTYTSAIKLSALNTAYAYAVGQADSALLTGQQTTASITGTLLGTALPSDYFRYVASCASGKSPVQWIEKVEIDNLAKLDNYFVQGTGSSPKCAIFNSKYYLFVDTYSTANATIRLYYIKTPTALTAVATQCPVHLALHPILIRMAEAELRASYKYGDFAQAEAMRTSAIEQILALNAQVKQGALPT